jgi:tRNA pseudouridine38-40 synthase
MPTFKITLAYDGTEFSGWQVQPGQRTVQGVLEVVLRQLTGQTVRVWGASRTDSGVHALGQVAAFSLQTRLSPEELLRGMNALLPPDVVVWHIEETSPRFWPSRDATAKRYRYLLYDGVVRHIFLRRYLWQVDQRLDVEAMHRAGQYLVGTHDFASFQSRGSPRQETVRTLFDVSVRRCGEGEGGLWLWQIPSPSLDSVRPPADGGQTSGTSLTDGAGQGGGEQKITQSEPEPPPPPLSSAPPQAADQPHSPRQNPEGDLILVEVEGDGFLYHMVRAIVGTLVEIGRGNRPPEWMAEVLAARNRSAAGKTAPPEGLYLLYVRFDLPRSAPTIWQPTCVPLPPEETLPQE